MRHRNDLLQRNRHPQHIGALADGKQRSSLCQHGIQCVKIQRSIRLNGTSPKFPPCFFAQLLPGDEVRVMLQFRDHNGPRPVRKGRRHPVDAIGGAGGKGDLARLGSKELGADRSCLLVGVGAATGQAVDAPMDIAPEQLHFPHRLHHLRRHLHGCSIVQIDERMAVDGLGQGGKVPANPLYVEGIFRFFRAFHRYRRPLRRILLLMVADKRSQLRNRADFRKFRRSHGDVEHLLHSLHQQHLFRDHRAGPGAGPGNLPGVNAHALQRQHMPQTDVRQIQQLFTGAHLLCQQKAIQDIPLNQRVYMVIIPLAQA